MPIIGDHPETGLRVSLERPLRGGPPWVYEGEVFTPGAKLGARVTVGGDGDVTVVLAEEAIEGIAEKLRLMFRALYKQAKELPGGQPPRKVVRWRDGTRRGPHQTEK